MKSDVGLGEQHEERPLSWWQEVGEVLYPTLATLAYNLFSIPGMSSECERAFSQAKEMISDERYNLEPDVIEVDQWLKSSLRSRLVNGAATWQPLVELKACEAAFEAAEKAAVKAAAVAVQAANAVVELCDELP